MTLKKLILLLTATIICGGVFAVKRPAITTGSTTAAVNQSLTLAYPEEFRQGNSGTILMDLFDPTNGTANTIIAQNRLAGYNRIDASTYLIAEAKDNLKNCNFNSFELNIQFQVKYFTATLSNGTASLSSFTTTQIIPIKYNKLTGLLSAEKALLEVPGALYVSVKLIGYTPSSAATYLPEINFRLEMQQALERPVNTNLTPTISLSTTSDNKINVSWTKLDDASFYELEWTHVDYHATTSGGSSDYSYSFRNNATRIRTSANSYTITNVFERGIVAFRVRAVYELYNTPLQTGNSNTNQLYRVEGAWSAPNSGNNVTSLSGNYVTISTSGNTAAHQPNINWIYQASYAEEGAKQEGISYHDGLLRLRQTVAKQAYIETGNPNSSSTEAVVVNEPIYDFNGREAISTIPSLVFKPNASDKGAYEYELKYYSNFTVNQNGTPYTWADFDKDNQGQCTRTAVPMGSNNGPEKYYSSNNPLTTTSLNNMPGGLPVPVPNFNDYIPKTNGYPFVQRNFVPDQSGDIRSVSGIGETHKLGSGHETFHYKTTPFQDELDMLFGENVGYAKYYAKEIIIDPNGQTSLSYTNLKGQVIATALDGPTPTSLTALGSQGSRPTTVNLLETSHARPIADGLLFSYDHIAPLAGQYTFNYQITRESFDANTCNAANNTMCFDCVYDLEIGILDECGNQMLQGLSGSGAVSPIRLRLGPEYSALNTMCNESLAYDIRNDSRINTPITVTLPKGKYTIYKKLTVNAEARDFYLQKHLEENKCLRSYASFLAEEEAKIDPTLCNVTCASCLASLGTLSSYISKYKTTTTPSTEETTRLTNEYNKKVAECNELCKTYNSCDVLYETMLSDVSPGGQYAQYKTDANGVFVAELDETNPIGSIVYDNYNILGPTTNNGIPNKVTSYTNASLAFNIAKEIVSINGVNKYVSQLTVHEFITNFRKSWAEELVKYHPEYCRYQYCLTLNTSNTYDQEMLAIETFDDAKNAGFFNPLPPPSSFPTDGWAVNQDPFFISTGTGHAQASDISAKIFDDYLGLGYGMLKLVFGTYYCNEEDPGNFTNCVTNAFNDPNSCQENKNLVWRLFRSFYVKEKIAATNILKQGRPCFNITIPDYKVERNPIYNTPSNYTDAETSEKQSAALDSMNNQFSEQCEAYADTWLIKLNSCGLSENQKTQLKNEFIKICMLGSDEGHPFGSSSIPPGVNNTYSSFQDYLQKQGLYIPGICDASLINMPPPYLNQDLFAGEDPMNDTCACAAENQKKSVFGFRCEGVDASTQYKAIRIARSENPAQASSGGEEGCVNCDDLHTIKLPALIENRNTANPSCLTCIGCDDIHEVIKEMLTDGGQEVLSLANIQEVFVSRANYKFNLNLTLDDYITFMDKCMIGSNVAQAADLTTILSNYYTYYHSLFPTEGPNLLRPLVEPNAAGYTPLPNQSTLSVYYFNCPGELITLGWNNLSPQAGFLYEWTPSLFFNNIANNSGITRPINPNHDVTYQLRVYRQSDNRLVDLRSFIVRQKPGACAITSVNQFTVCKTESIQIGANITANPNLTYQWIDLSTNTTMLATTPTTQVGPVATAGTQQYVLKIWDGGIGGTMLTSQTFTVNFVTCTGISNPNLRPAAGQNRVICQGESTILGTIINLTGDPVGDLGYTYSWSPSGTGSTLLNFTVTPTTSTTYYLTVKNGDAIVGIYPVTVTVNTGCVQKEIRACAGEAFKLGPVAIGPDETLEWYDPISKTWTSISGSYPTVTASSTPGNYIYRLKHTYNVSKANEGGSYTVFTDYRVIIENCCKMPRVVSCADINTLVANTANAGKAPGYSEFYEYATSEFNNNQFDELHLTVSEIRRMHVTCSGGESFAACKRLVPKCNKTLPYLQEMLSNLFTATPTAHLNSFTYNSVNHIVTPTNGSQTVNYQETFLAGTFNLSLRNEVYNILFSCCTAAECSYDYWGTNNTTFTTTYLNNSVYEISIPFSSPNACSPAAKLQLNYLANPKGFLNIAQVLEVKLAYQRAGEAEVNKHLFLIKVKHTDGTESTLEGYLSCPVADVVDFSIQSPVIFSNNESNSPGNPTVISCPKLCNKSINPPLPTPIDPCIEYQQRQAKIRAQLRFAEYIKDARIAFLKAYTAKCMSAIGGPQEVFTMSYTDTRHHFTLYYYDQSENLVATVPPQGVRPITNATTLAQISTNRINKSGTIFTKHYYSTDYYYDSYNQLVLQEQATRLQNDWTKRYDSELMLTHFYYDVLGRLIFSQNRKQAAANKYSYTYFDGLSRIQEVGEVSGTISQASLDNPVNNTWFNGNTMTKNDITTTFYDVYTLNIPGFTPECLRGRVVHTTFTPSGNTNTNYTYAAHYSYDVHGNVKTLIREFAPLRSTGSSPYKRIDYQYDLISGKVLEVAYQRNENDQLIHTYEYDANIRLIRARTATTHRGLTDKDAAYFYYPHGPLRRVEYGGQIVQGVDYTYTATGWLKGVNSGSLNAGNDIGKDGIPVTSGQELHSNIARDEFGFTLGYYDGDYNPIQTINAAQFFEVDKTNSFLAGYRPLYNGNINHMVTAINKLMTNHVPLASRYQYDQLNRIKAAEYFNQVDAGYTTNNRWAASGTPALTAHLNTFTYDANGNILVQKRNGSGFSGTAMDELTYQYQKSVTVNGTTGLIENNRLRSVNDAVAAANYPTDIDNQANNNYAYDDVGNLTKDEAEEIANIEWNVYGKITRIIRTANSTKPDLAFEYSPEGHRVAKIVKPKGTDAYWNYTYYVHDAQGNTLATYDVKLRNEEKTAPVTFSMVNNALQQPGAPLDFANFAIGLYNLDGDNTHWEAFFDAANELNKIEPMLNQVKLNDLLNNDPWFVRALLAVYDKNTLLKDLQGQGIAYSDLLKYNCSSDPSAFLAHAINYDLLVFLENLYMDDYSAFADLAQNFANIWLSGDQGSDITELYQTILANYMGSQQSSLINYLIDNLGFDCNRLGSLYTHYYNEPFSLSLLSTYPSFVNNMLSNVAYNNLTAALLSNENVVRQLMQENMELFAQRLYDGGTLGDIRPKDLAHAHPEIITQMQTYHAGLTLTQYMQAIASAYGTTYYNQLATTLRYNSKVFVQELVLNEWYLYGSDRLGSATANKLLHTHKFDANYTINAATCTFTDVIEISSISEPLPAGGLYLFERGRKRYELKNHLGNVLAVVSDKKLAQCSQAVAYNETFSGANNTGGFTASGATLSNSNSSRLTISSSNYYVPVNSPSFALTPGKTYVLSLDLEQAPSQVVNAYIAYSNNTSTYVRWMGAQSGTYQIVFVAQHSSAKLQLQGYPGVYYVDNVSVKELATEASTFEYYKADVAEANDYSPFGAPMAERNWLPIDENNLKQVVAPDEFTNGTDNWSISSNGSLSVSAGRLQLLTYDPAQPVAQKNYPTEANKTYRFSMDMSIDGITYANLVLRDNLGAELYRKQVSVTGKQVIEFTAPGTSVTLQVEMAPGNYGRLLFIDNVWLQETAKLSGYRFGFNGKENDKETYGEGNAYDFGARVYDPRLGRMLSIDKYASSFPDWSPYVYCADNPIYFVDKDGNMWGPHEMAQFAMEAAILKIANPTWSNARIATVAFWNVMSGQIHTMLDVLGMIPAAGEIADGINGGLYLLEGDGVNASISFAGMIPFAGWTATGARTAMKVIKTAKGAKTVLYATKGADGLISFGNRSQLGKILGSSTAEHAHHIIPWELGSNKVVQQAAEAGFHMNDAINGVLMKASKHLTGRGHDAYNAYVQKQLTEFAKGKKLTPEACKEYLEKTLIPELENHIKKAGDNLNEYFQKLNE